MKISKRLLAVLMSVVMVLTIVPLGLFAFADGETPEPKTETETIKIDSIAELQLIGNDPAYPAAPTKAKAEDGAEVTTNYIYKITKDLNAADENFDAWFAANKEAARKTFDKYVVVPDTITEIPEGAQYYTKNGESYEIVADMATVTIPITADTYYTLEPRDDFETTPLTSDEKTQLVEKFSIPETIDFTPITSLEGVTIDGAYAEGKVATISGLNIKSVTSKDGSVCAGLVAATINNCAITNVALDNTCVIKANGNGNGNVYAGSFIAYGVSTALKNIASSAKVEVSNKLYSAKSDENTSNACATYAGGLVGFGALSSISNSAFSGSVDFSYDSNSFTDVELDDIYKKTTIFIGGIIAYDGIVKIDETTKADSATLTSTYLGVAVRAGKLAASKNDYVLLSAFTKDAQTYPNIETGYQNVDIFGVAQTEDNKPDENGYQLIKATDTESGITYAYIRTPVCGHVNLNSVDANDATCAANGNIAYVQCSDCGKYFKDNTCAEEITLDQTVISKDTIAHTLGAPIKAKDATCTETGIAYDYYQCSVCKKYFKDAEGTQEVKEDDWVTKALGHAWDSGTVTKDPTYDEEGEKTFHCTRDGCTETKTEPIAKKTPPSVSPKSGSGYKATTTGGKNTIILPNPSNSNGTTVASFKSNLKDGYEYVIKNASGRTVSNVNDPIGTNYTVEIRINGSLYAKTIVIVRGDVDCNGRIGSGDYVKVKKHLRGTGVITDPILLVAADADNKNSVSSADYIRIKRIMRNK